MGSQCKFLKKKLLYAEKYLHAMELKFTGYLDRVIIFLLNKQTKYPVKFRYLELLETHFMIVNIMITRAVVTPSSADLFLKMPPLNIHDHT